MKVYIVYFLFFISIFNTYGQKLPEWVLNPNVKYKEDKYLTAVGEGETLKEAEINAYQNLAKMFSVSVEFDAEALDKWNESSYNTEKNSLYTENTQLQSYAELFSVQFKEKHYSKKEELYRILAVIDKKNFIRILNRKIEENEKSIESYLKNTPDSPIEKYSNINMALILAQKSKMYREELIILGENPKELKYNPDEIKLMKLKAADKMTFSLKLEYDNTALAQSIEKIISKSGLRLVRSNAAYIFEVRVDYHVRDIPSFAGGGVNVFYQFQIELRDYTGKLLHVFSFEESTGEQYGKTEYEAKKIIFDKLNTVVNKEFEKLFSDFL